MDEEHGAAAGASGHRSGRMYQLPAEQSGSSIFEGVEMAQEEVGPSVDVWYVLYEAR